jgi:hypothetical protein
MGLLVVVHADWTMGQQTKPMPVEAPQTLSFFVEGTPQTAGSKRGFAHPTTGRVIITEDSKGDTGKRKRAWREDVREAARRAIAEGDSSGGLGPEWDWPTDAPLAVTFTFYRRRPKGHHGSGRNAGVVKDSAPRHPTTRPDVLKLARAAEDALTGIVWHDDAVIVDETLRKVWGEREGLLVVVRLAV